MDPIEINAGRWYLRALRADKRVDDTPSLRGAGITDEDYIARRLRQWSTDEFYSWAVCVPETGEMVAEIWLNPNSDSAQVGGWALNGYDEAFAEGTAAVRRFAESRLGLAVEGQWPM